LPISFRVSSIQQFCSLTASDLLFGARFDKTTSVWKWSDGSVASFSIPQNTSGKDCLQKILEHRSGTFLDRNCAGFKAPYACEFKRTEIKSLQSILCFVYFRSYRIYVSQE